MPTPQHSQPQKSKDTRIKINGRAYRHTPRGKLIELLHAHPRGKEAIAWETLEARFLPWVLEPEDELARETALACALTLKGYLEQILLQWDLPELGLTAGPQERSPADPQPEAQELPEPEPETRSISQALRERDQRQDSIFG